MVARIDPSAFDPDEPTDANEREANTPEQLLRTCLPADIPAAANCLEQFYFIDCGSQLSYLQSAYRRIIEALADAEDEEFRAVLLTIESLSDHMRTNMATLSGVLETLRRRKENPE